jgi:hypothetical protein
MAYGPYEQGIQFLVSQEVYEIIGKYKLPVYNKIPVKIDTFNKRYFLLGFPMIEFSEIDFSRSIFFDYNAGEKVVYKNYNDYQFSEYSRKLATPQRIFLKNKFEYDIIDTAKGTFFIKEIVEEFNKNNITGYQIKEGILEN